MSRKKRFKHAVKKEAKLEKLALASLVTVTVGMVGTTLVHADDVVPAPSAELVGAPKAGATEVPAENPTSPVSADSKTPASEATDTAASTTPSSETNHPVEPVTEPSQPATSEKNGEPTLINEKDPDYNKPITVKEINRIKLDDGTYKIIDEHVVTVNPGGFGLFNIPDLTAKKLIIPADGVFEYGPRIISYKQLKLYRIQEFVNTYVYRDSVTALPMKTLHDSSGLVTAEVYAPSAIAVKTISVSKLVEPKDVDKVFVASATQKAEVYQVEMLKTDGTPYAYSGWKNFTIKTDKNRQVDEVLYFPFQSDRAERLSFKVDDTGNLTFTVPGGVRSVSPENYVVVYRLNTPSEPSKPVNPKTPAQSTETLTNLDKNVSVTLTGADVAAVDKIVADKVSDKGVLAKLPAEMPAKDVELYDVKTQKADGSFVQITGEAVVTLPVDASRKVVKVIYFLPETGAVEELPFKLSADGKSVRFKVTHFSNYGIVYQAKSSEHSVTPSKPVEQAKTTKPVEQDKLSTKTTDIQVKSTTIDNKVDATKLDGRKVQNIVSEDSSVSKTSKSDSKEESKNEQRYLPNTGSYSRVERQMALGGYGIFGLSLGLLGFVVRRKRKH